MSIGLDYKLTDKNWKKKEVVHKDKLTYRVILSKGKLQITIQYEITYGV